MAQSIIHTCQVIFNSANFWKLPLLVAALAVFTGQTFLCHAENAGLILCVYALDQDCEEAPERSGEPSKESPVNGCQNAGCHSPIFAPERLVIAVLILDHHPDEYSAVDQILPESPVSEIDYPPQLS